MLNSITTIWLPIVALVLSALAITPYVLEGYLYVRHKPRFNIKVTNIHIQPPSDESKSIVEFELRINLREDSRPIVLKRVSVGWPWDRAQPVKHKHSISVPAWMQQAILSPQEGVCLPESGVRLILHTGETFFEPEPEALFLYPLAFYLIGDVDSLSLDIVIRSQVDSAGLGFFSIFYHTGEYVTHQIISVPISAM